MTERRAHLRPGAALAVAVAAAVVTVGAGCSIEGTMPAPDCSSGGSGIIVAQSVPSASYVPCFETLPDGWSVTSVSVNQDRSVIRLDSDRAGGNAATLRLLPECDVANAVSAPSEYEGTERFDHIERLAPGFRANRFYRFAGGCVTWDFDFDVDASATESVALGDALRLIPRRQLSDQLRDTFVGVGL